MAKKRFSAELIVTLLRQISRLPDYRLVGLPWPIVTSMRSTSLCVA
jgi:hypothetical protein